MDRKEPDTATRPKNRGGRPGRVIQPGDRAQLSFRVTKERKDRITAAAAASGRSIAQECEYRIDRSFENLDLIKEAFGGDTGWRLALTLFANFRPDRARLYGQAPSWGWLNDPEAYDIATRTLLEAIKRDRPEQLEDQAETPAGGVASSDHVAPVKARAA